MVVAKLIARLQGPQSRFGQETENFFVLKKLEEETSKKKDGRGQKLQPLLKAMESVSQKRQSVEIEMRNHSKPISPAPFSCPYNREILGFPHWISPHVDLLRRCRQVARSRWFDPIVALQIGRAHV